MTPQEALAKLTEAGENSGSDYDDGADGWFGWSVDSEHAETGVLRITWQAATESGNAGPEQEFAWELTTRGAS
jgi:hypothetical protein